MKPSIARSQVSNAKAAGHPRRILLLDFWSDRNRGDAAMQIAMIRMLRDLVPDVRLTIMTAYGCNQWPDQVGEFDESGPLADDMVGGLQPTFVQFDASTSKWERRAKKAFGAVSGI